MKHQIQSAIRRLHVWLARDLPEKLGVYFHDLPADDWNAFRSTVGLFRDAGYRFVKADELARRSTGKAAYLSFDDNHRNWREALGLFEELDVQVTFYVSTAPLRDRAEPGEIRSYFTRINGDPETSIPLSSGEVAELAAHGHTIGAHAHSHTSLADLSEVEARTEIDKSRAILARIIGAPIEHFSYPFGQRRHFTEALRSHCMSTGFRTVANAIPGMQFAGHRPEAIQRTPWNLRLPSEHNLENLRIDGRLFERLTGRSAAPF